MGITKVKSDYIITLAEAKAHLRVDTTTEDTYITSLIKSAVDYVENYLNKDVVETINTLVIPNFSGFLVEVDEGNFASITSVKNAANETILTQYLRVYDSYFEFSLETGQSQSDITVVFKTGYVAATLPPSIRQYILIKIGDLYDVERNSYAFNTITRQRLEEMLLSFHQAKKIKSIDYNKFVYKNY